MTDIEVRKVIDGTTKVKLYVFCFVLFLLTVSVTSCVPAPWDIPSKIFHLGSTFVAFLFAVAGIVMYFLPTIVGALRQVKGLVGILLVNIFLGWTIIGWIVALIWSLVGAKGRA